MKTDTNKWMVDISGLKMFIVSGDFQVCVIGDKNSEYNQENAELIVAAVNACKEINHDNPLNAAKAIPYLLEALKKVVELNLFNPYISGMDTVQKAFKEATK